MAALLDLHDKQRFGVLHGVDDPVTSFLDQGQQALDGFYNDHQGGAVRTNRCLRARAASGWAMEVRCIHCWDGLRRAPSTTLTPARVQELAQQLPDLATLRSKLRCQRCGKRDGQLRVVPG